VIEIETRVEAEGGRGDVYYLKVRARSHTHTIDTQSNINTGKLPCLKCTQVYHVSYLNCTHIMPTLFIDVSST
jgi:hypothetical protein